MTDNERDLMDAFLRCILVNEGFACEIAEIANQCEQDGNHGIAAALLNISRNHRIRGMVNRANLVALTQRHAE